MPRGLRLDSVISWREGEQEKMTQTTPRYLQDYVAGDFPDTRRSEWFGGAALEAAQARTAHECKLRAKIVEMTSVQFASDELHSRKSYLSRVIDNFDSGSAFEEGVKLVELLDEIWAISTVFSLRQNEHRDFLRQAIYKRAEDHPDFLRQLAETSELGVLGALAN